MEFAITTLTKNGWVVEICRQTPECDYESTRLNLMKIRDPTQLPTSPAPTVIEVECFPNTCTTFSCPFSTITYRAYGSNPSGRPFTLWYTSNPCGSLVRNWNDISRHNLQITQYHTAIIFVEP